MNDPSIDRLINLLSSLPGIGKRGATRIVFRLLEHDSAKAKQLVGELTDTINKIHSCPVCGFPASENLCIYCSDPTRNKNIICVVEHPFDTEPIENSGQFRGLYHILGGKLSPLDGIGPKNLNIESLIQRVSSGKTKEVILATSPNTDGDTTALFIRKLLEPFRIKITRPARGIPSGVNLEFIDELTMSHALKNRKGY